MIKSFLAIIFLVGMLGFVVTGWISIWNKPLNFNILSFVPMYTWGFLGASVLAIASALWSDWVAVKLTAERE